MAFDVDDDFVNRLFHIESGNIPDQVTGSNRGLGQFSPDLERRYGITDWTNRDQQTSAVRQEMAEFGPRMRNVLGRDPTPGEAYLFHQQGAAGASAHFGNPDGTAWQNIRPYYSSDAIAKKAIWDNVPSNPRLSPSFNKSMFPGGVDDVTSGNFTTGWVNKFQGSPSATVASAVPAAAPPVSGSVPLGAGMLAGTDAINQPRYAMLGGADAGQSQQQNDTTSAFGRIGNLFAQNAQQDQQALSQAHQAATPPIRYPVPAALRMRMQQLLRG